MAHAPEISIITPVWNGLPYLKECIDSVLKQDFDNWEMLVSDDGSTDGSREYLDTLNDPRIFVFKQERNQGIFGNLNFLFARAKAPICQILCQDDYMVKPNAIGTLITYWEKAPSNIGFVRFNHENVGMCSLTRFQKEFIPAVLTIDKADLFFFIFGNIPGNLSNVSLKSELLGSCGEFNTLLPYAGDCEFWIRANNKYDMGIENETIIHIRRHPGVASISLNKNGELIAQKAFIVTALFEKLNKKFGGKKMLFKLFATLNYDSLQRDSALRFALKGKTGYLKELNRVSGKLIYILKSPARWILFFISIGGRFGRVFTAKTIFKSLSAQNN